MSQKASFDISLESLISDYSGSTNDPDYKPPSQPTSISSLSSTDSKDQPSLQDTIEETAHADTSRAQGEVHGRGRGGQHYETAAAGPGGHLGARVGTGQTPGGVDDRDRGVGREGQHYEIAAGRARGDLGACVGTGQGQGGEHVRNRGVGRGGQYDECAAAGLGGGRGGDLGANYDTGQAQGGVRGRDRGVGRGGGQYDESAAGGAQGDLGALVGIGQGQGGEHGRNRGVGMGGQHDECAATGPGGGRGGDLGTHYDTGQAQGGVHGRGRGGDLGANYDAGQAQGGVHGRGRGIGRGEGQYDESAAGGALGDLGALVGIGQGQGGEHGRNRGVGMGGQQDESAAAGPGGGRGGNLGPHDNAKEATADEKDDAQANPQLQDRNVISRLKVSNVGLKAEEYLEKNKPQNSKKGIKTALNAFQAVIKELNSEEDRELTKIPNKELAEYLEKFFMGVMKQDGTSYNAATLGTYYNNLARYFLEEAKIDIKNGAEFIRLPKVVTRRQEESAKEGLIPGMNASKPIPKAVLAKVHASGEIGMKDPKSLTAKVIMNFQVGFGIRNGEEMHEIRNKDLKLGPLNGEGIPEFLELAERVTKTRRGSKAQGNRAFVPKITRNDEDPDSCMVRPFVKMQTKKTEKLLQPDQPLFLGCKTLKNPEQHNVWFINMRMGSHTIGSMIVDQIEKAGFDTKDLKITGCSLRKNMFDAMVEGDVPDVIMSAHGGHKNLQSKESYVSKTEAAKKAINKIVADSLAGKEARNFQEIVSAEKRKETEEIELLKMAGSDEKENLPPLAKKPSLDLPKVNRFHSKSRPLASCLKVRYMFDVTKQTNSQWVTQIKKTILKLCHESVIYHIGVDTVSEEGLVFVKTASLDDAGKAAKHLNEVATAKYLLLDKYYERFPEARHSNTPMTVRVLSQPSQAALQSQLSQDTPQSQLSQDAPQSQLSQDALHSQLSQDSPHNQCFQGAPQSQFSRENPRGQGTQNASLMLHQQTPARSTHLSQQQQSYHPIPQQTPSSSYHLQQFRSQSDQQQTAYSPMLHHLHQTPFSLQGSPSPQSLPQQLPYSPMFPQQASFSPYSLQQSPALMPLQQPQFIHHPTPALQMYNEPRYPQLQMLSSMPPYQLSSPQMIRPSPSQYQMSPPYPAAMPQAGTTLSFGMAQISAPVRSFTSEQQVTRDENGIYRAVNRQSHMSYGGAGSCDQAGQNGNNNGGQMY